MGEYSSIASVFPRVRFVRILICPFISSFLRSPIGGKRRDSPGGASGETSARD